MTNDTFSSIAPQPTIAETITMLRNPQLVIGWALEHLPEELFTFFTEWKAHEDEYVWVTNMTGWVEEVRIRQELAAEMTNDPAS